MQEHATPIETPRYEMTPPHPPRIDTPLYEKSHKFLVHDQDTPCRVCGVRQSTLLDPTKNIHGAKDIETHHFPIERSLADACDPIKVHKVFPYVIDRETLMHLVDSPDNLIVLCDYCHRSPERGIHHLLVQDWAILPFLYDNYQITATQADVAAVEAENSRIIAKEGQV